MREPISTDPWPDARQLTNAEWLRLHDRLVAQAHIEQHRATKQMWTLVARWLRALLRRENNPLHASTTMAAK